MSDTQQPSGELLIYQSDDGQVHLSVRLHQETVWLTQILMAEMFQASQQNISQHINNIYDECELIREATHKKILSVAHGHLGRTSGGHLGTFKNMITHIIYPHTLSRWYIGPFQQHRPAEC